MNPGKRMQMLDDKKRRLSEKNDEYKKLVEICADKKREYNIAFAKQLIRARLDGTPITIAKDLVRGDPVVSQLEMDYEVSLGMTRACLESMKDIREALGADRSILTWLREEKGQG